MAETFPLNSDNSVSIEKLDYAYIKTCSNAKELGKILRVLRSGREGYYPDLIEFCEKRLEMVCPESKALWKQQKVLQPRDLKHDELAELDENLKEWEERMKGSQQNTEKPRVNGHGDYSDLPPIRTAQVLKGNKKDKVDAPGGKKSTNEKIKGSDYRAWDKFDVESECAKIDVEAKKDTPVQNQKVNIPDQINTAGLNDTEKELKAINEKNKGNEAFKAGDFEEALSYYSRSISLLPTAASFNNRALVYLKLEKWQSAAQDCDRVLASPGEEQNVKAKLRRAAAYKSLCKYEEAKADLDMVLQKEPNNARAKSILKEIEKFKGSKKLEKEAAREEQTKMEPSKPGKTMVITEVDGDSEDDEEESASQDTAVRKSSSNVEQQTDERMESDKTMLDADKKRDGEVGNAVDVTPKFPPDTDILKTKAAEYFKSGNYGDAVKYYTEAIESMAVHPDSSESSYILALAVLHNNRAACWLKLGNDRSCITDCAKVLELKPWDVKALMRRGVAYEHMEKYALSYTDFKSAESIDWNNAFAQDGANRAAAHLREIYGHKWRDSVPPVPMYSHRNNTSQVDRVVAASEDAQNSASFDKVVGNRTPEGKSESNLSSIKNNNGAISNISTTTLKNMVSGHQPDDKQDAAEYYSKPNSIDIKEFTSKTKKEKQPKNPPKTKSAAKSKKLAKDQAKLKEEEEKEAKRAEIRRKLFNELKTQGNDHVKKAEYVHAIQCYTKCVTVCPKEPASYTNRALCFLKMGKNVSAANDCTEALKLDPVNVKAYYRRSQARKAERMYKDALKDIKKLLEIDPKSKVAEAELACLTILVDNEVGKQSLAGEEGVKKGMRTDAVKSSKAAPPGKKIVIEEVDSSSSDEAEFVLPTDNIQKQEDDSVSPTQHSRTLTDTPADRQPPQETQDTKTMPEQIRVNAEFLAQPLKNVGNQTSKLPEDTTSTLSTKPSVKKTIKAPSDKPVTPYEFGTLWNAIADKSNIDAYKDLLSGIKPDMLPYLISNKIDDHLISVVAKTALAHVKEENDYQRAFDMMYHLSKADRFVMASMFLSDQDSRTVRAVFDALSSQSNHPYSPKELEALFKTYNL